MIPLRDLNPTRTQPLVTWVIVGINVLVFLATWSDLDGAAQRLGAVAWHITGAEPTIVRTPYGVVLPVPYDDWWPLRILTHFWVHGGVLHLLGNMWFLWVFGDNVEDRLGRARYVLLYVASALAALGTQVLAEPDSGIPMVGASGAIGGVLGAYLRMFPKARVIALVPLGFIFFTVVWPAAAFIGLWFVLQLVNASTSAGPGVAWWAHVGGFAAGFLLAWPRRAPPPPWRSPSRRFGTPY
ncbi:MAG: rhomboid family intramembrane serine protease [Planctomycetes bacterium]|nr:rhomboid family intramembrane serine protease [Planctomycetota bacterium]